jgi:DNA-binding transcriptional ArsR family regulator
MHSLHALGDPTRQRIVEMLAAGTLTSGDIARRFDVSAPAISQHLKTLRAAGLVRVRPQALGRAPRLAGEGVAQMTTLDGEVTRNADGGLVVAFDRTLDRSPTKVWAALTDPRILANWLGEVEVDLRVGGAFVIRFR